MAEDEAVDGLIGTVIVGIVIRVISGGLVDPEEKLVSAAALRGGHFRARHFGAAAAVLVAVARAPRPLRRG